MITRRSPRWGRAGLGVVAFVLAAATGFCVQTQRARNTRENPSPALYRNTRPGVAYVGSAQCATCHEDIYESFRKTRMGRSMGPANAPPEVARITSPVTVVDPKSNRTFEVYRDGPSLYQTEYKLDSNGREVFHHTERLAFVIGSGAVGLTYVVERGAYLFQAPLSFYSRTGRWGLSPGYEFQDFGFSRPILAQCIVCHSGQPRPALPNTSGGSPFDAEPFQAAAPPFAEFPISCENCHGPGQFHVQERLKWLPVSGDTDFSIVNPAKLSPWLSNNICMNCHQGGRHSRPQARAQPFQLPSRDAAGSNSGDPATPLEPGVAPAVPAARALLRDDSEQVLHSERRAIKVHHVSRSSPGTSEPRGARVFPSEMPELPL